MKHFISILLCTIMVLSMCACSGDVSQTTSEIDHVETSSVAEGLLIAGTYTASAVGKNGDVTVRVTVSSTEILSVEILEHQETPGVADPALEQIPEAITANQSVGVDAITNATVTSEAILAAVSDCLVQAGANLNDWSAKVAAEVGENQEITADVIVVGGGAAGLAAAASAAESGADVILIEAAAICGGTTNLSAGFVAAVYDEFNQKLELTDEQVAAYNKYLDYDPAEFGDYAEDLITLQSQIREYLESGDHHFFDSVERFMIDHYVATKKTDLDGVETSADYELCHAAFSNTMKIVNKLEAAGMTWGDKYMSTRSLNPYGSASGAKLIECMQGIAEDAGVAIMYNTRGQELLTDNNGVCGVVAIGTDGAMVTLHANKGVILATGGFASNTEMCAQYNRIYTGVSANTASDNCATSVGDGILMAQSVGANLVDMQFIQLLGRSVNGYSQGNATSGAAMLINADGERFVNESNNANILTAAANLPDGAYFSVGGSAFAETLGEETLNRMISQGWAWQADTLEEACELAGLDAATVAATAEKFNSYVDAGEDPDFGRASFTGKVEGETYVITALCTAWHHTMGGIQINVNAEVLDTEGNIINGLYAAGEVCGGIEAGARQSGDNLEEIIYFGMTAGENAAAK